MTDRNNSSNAMSLGKAIRLAEAAFQQKFNREINAASSVDKSWFNGYIEALTSDTSPDETPVAPNPLRTALQEVCRHSAVGSVVYQIAAKAIADSFVETGAES